MLPTSTSTASRRRCTWRRCGSATSPSTPELVDTYSTPTHLRLATGEQLDAAQFVTHHFAMNDMIEAYEPFARAADTGALKVEIKPGNKAAG